jgi:hypothetical protein
MILVPYMPVLDPLKHAGVPTTCFCRSSSYVISAYPSTEPYTQSFQSSNGLFVPALDSDLSTE